jgi:dodecin
MPLVKSHHEERTMTDHVYKTIHITGTSKQGVEEAIKGAVAKAASSVHNLRWFKVTDVRGEISGAKVEYWQVSLEVGFTLD